MVSAGRPFVYTLGAEKETISQEGSLLDSQVRNR